MKCSDFSLERNYETMQVNLLDYIYPLYGGLIKIPIKIDMFLNYGWVFSYKKSSDILCKLNFQPYAKPSLKSLAKMNFLSIGEAGIEARGNLANTKLNFGADIYMRILLAEFYLNASV